MLTIATQGLPEEGEATPSPANSGGRRDLNRTLISGFAWGTASRLVTQAISFASTFLVVRLLSPADYGLVAMAGLYIGIVSLVSEMGLGSAVLRIRSLTDHQVAQLNTVAVAAGAVMTLLSVVAAPLVASFFDESQLMHVIVAMSCLPLLGTLRSIPIGLIQRDGAFRKLAEIDVAQALMSTFVVLTLAILGAGFWALVAGQLAGAIAGTTYTLVSRSHPFSRPHASELGDALVYTRQMVTSRIAWYTYGNADGLVAGRLLGRASLGVYGFAMSMTSMPLEKISSLISSVTHVFFAQIQDDRPALRYYLLMMVEGLCLLVLPLTMGMALVADDFVRVIAGEKWAAAVLPLRILSVYISVRAVTALLTQVLSTIGAMSLVARTSITGALLMPPAFALGAYMGGTAGIASMWALLYPVIIVPQYREIFRQLGFGPRDLFRAVWSSLSCSAAMIIAVLGTRWSILEHLDPAARLGVSVVIGAIAYTAVFLWKFRQRFTAFLGILRDARSAY